jgi:hypothetical protein
MKRHGCLAVVLLSASAAPGAAQAAAAATVTVRVAAQVSVEPAVRAVRVQAAGAGPVRATAAFRVTANVEALLLFVEATSLHHSGAGGVPPIALDERAGAVIAPDGAGGQVGRFVADAAVGGLPARRTAAVGFRNRQRGRFRRDVRVTVTWRPAGSGRPPGQYAGRIRLTALLMPPAPRPACTGWSARSSSAPARGPPGAARWAQCRPTGAPCWP